MPPRFLVRGALIAPLTSTVSSLLDEARLTTYCDAVVILHRLVIVGLVVALLALAPVAHASPPDQSWIGGLYDNGDFDDVVLLITGDLGAFQQSIVSSLRPVAAAVGLVTPMDSEPRRLSPQSCDLSRAPPLA